MKDAPMIVTTAQGLEHFKTIGEVVKAFMLFDVVFVYANGNLLHYQGILGGWIFYKAIPMERKDADSYINNWAAA